MQLFALVTTTTLAKEVPKLMALNKGVPLPDQLGFELVDELLRAN